MTPPLDTPHDWFARIARRAVMDVALADLVARLAVEAMRRG